METVHGSLAIGVSDRFLCRECGASVMLAQLLGGDLAYECISPRCGKTVMVNCPEALAERIILVLPLQAAQLAEALA